MPTVVPIDELVADEGYPGCRDLDDGTTPSPIDPYSRFRAGDQDRFWFLDFHWPRGLTPMGLISLADGYARGAQHAARVLRLPSGRGITVRTAGTHAYAAEVPLDRPGERDVRSRDFARRLPAFVQDFEQIWRHRSAEIDADWVRLRDAGRSIGSRAELAGYLLRARAHHRRAWEIHFELMYPLLANYLAFRGLCTELDIDPVDIGIFLGGRDNRITATDRELGALAGAARTMGLDDIFAVTEPESLSKVLRASGGRAVSWLSRFDGFLDEYGWRTEGIDDVALPSWTEDPTSPLGTIKTLLQKPELHDFDAARAASAAARDGAVDAARARLTSEEQRAFDAGLAACRRANFAWWNEEHDYHIDLRAALPLRCGIRTAAELLGADRPDDALYLFWPELMSVLNGRTTWRSLTALIGERRDYFEQWRARRASLPKVVGTVPVSVNDPILLEVFGINRHFLRAVGGNGAARSTTTLRGVRAAGGVARGIARVFTNADDLHRIRPGDILVCESTSPNWTPAFAKIAGCVCDGGGPLSHAAIVGREYAVPTVTAVGVATTVIRDGDDIEVDGTNGTVTVYLRRETTV